MWRAWLRRTRDPPVQPLEAYYAGSGIPAVTDWFEETHKRLPEVSMRILDGVPQIDSGPVLSNCARLDRNST